MSVAANSAGASLPRVAIVGGGLAGLAAATALSSRKCHVELFEARRQFGGRTASFREPATGEQIDYCQHVSMGCCTQLADFCRRTAVADRFQRYDTLHFFTAEGRRFDLRRNRWLPAPLHLAPALAGLKYLGLGDRLGIARAMWRLVRMRVDRLPAMTVAEWLAEQRQSAAAVDGFWKVVLVSALGERLDRAGLRYARQVFAEAFMGTRRGYEVLVPNEPLSELFGRRAVESLTRQGVTFHAEQPIDRVVIENGRVTAVELNGAGRQSFDAAIVAVPWRRAAELFDPAILAEDLGSLILAEQIPAAPITGIHLWFDRAITDLPHAVLVGMTSQWLFRRSGATTQAGEHYYQVVVSASYELANRDKAEIVKQVSAELRRVFPAARDAHLLRWRVVTDPLAVFSPGPDVDSRRPSQATSIANLALAGDWTDTGWPATMESAVRSGYAAADVISRALTCNRSSSSRPGAA